MKSESLLFVTLGLAFPSQGVNSVCNLVLPPLIQGRRNRSTDRPRRDRGGRDHDLSYCLILEIALHSILLGDF